MSLSGVSAAFWGHWAILTVRILRHGSHFPHQIQQIIFDQNSRVTKTTPYFIIALPQLFSPDAARSRYLTVFTYTP